jgi:hypothetical protein
MHYQYRTYRLVARVLGAFAQQNQHQRMKQLARRDLGLPVTRALRQVDNPREQ